MSLQELIQEVQSLGGQIRIDGERIRIQAPKGVITPDLADKLRERKAEIIRRMDLDARLSNLEVIVAIDKATNAAMLVFSTSDAEAIRHIATIYKPADAPLNEEQCSVLHEDLKYYESLLKRNERKTKNV